MLNYYVTIKHANINSKMGNFMGNTHDCQTFASRLWLMLLSPVGRTRLKRVDDAACHICHISDFCLEKGECQTQKLLYPG